VLAAADAAGREAAERVRASVERATEGMDPKEARRRRREAEDAAKRAARARRTETLDLALALSGAWFRDLAAVSEGAPDLVFAADRADELREGAEDLDPGAARRAADLVLETRRNLQVNVSEELALEGLFFKAEAALR
jgi:hypothetical protein